MGHKPDITTLAVAALLYGFCGATQAVEVVIDFDGVAAEYGYHGITNSYAEDGFTVTRTAGTGGILDNDFGTGECSATFTGGMLAEWTGGSFRFTRDDASPFTAVSLATGCYGNNVTDLSPFRLVGNYVDGGSVTNTYTPAQGANIVEMLGSSFTNLASLDYTSLDGLGSSAPIIDNLTLDDAVPPSPTLTVIDFNGSADDGAQSAIPLAATYTEDGYTLTVNAITAALVDNTWNSGHASVAPFDDDALLFWWEPPAGASVTFTCDNAQPFNAKSLIMGAYGTGAQMVLTGHVVGGATVTQTLSPAADSHITESLIGFTNLESLDIDSTGPDGVAPIIDDLTLDAYVPPPSGLVFIMIR